MDKYEKRLMASHDLWEAKASSRLESRGRLHRELTRLNSEGKIPDSTMIEVYDIMRESYAREESAEAKAQAAYDEAYTDEDV